MYGIQIKSLVVSVDRYMTKQYNDKKYTIEETPFAYCKRHWNKYYKNKTYDGVTISNYINKLKVDFL